MKYLHTMVRVHDLELSLRFYCDLLGLVEIRRTEYPAGEYTLVFLVAVDDIAQATSEYSPLLELTYNWDGEAYNGGRNFGHLAYEVDDIYQVCQRMLDNNIVLNVPPRDGRMAFLRSPDNISIELLQKGEPLAVIEPWLSMPIVGEW